MNKKHHQRSSKGRHNNKAQSPSDFVPLYINMWDCRLELGSLWGARERNHVADVLHAGDEEDETLETKAESSVWA